MPREIPQLPTTAPGPSAAVTQSLAVNPSALTIEEMSRLLSAAGGKRITVEQLQADLDAGAPAQFGNDGVIRMNLVHYAAWLAREVQTQ